MKLHTVRAKRGQAAITVFPKIRIVLACLALAGCSAIPVSDRLDGTADTTTWSEFKDRVDANGSLPVMPRVFDSLPFIEMLVGTADKTSKCAPNETKGEKFDANNYQCALNEFYNRTESLSESDKRLERNRIQERILSISEERCNSYKKYIRYDQSSSNFWLGSAATVLGGLGAISSHLGSARAFSAAGGVLSGIGAEYNQAYFGNLFYTVISEGIDERRREAYRQIQTYGQVKNLSEYPVESAIKDAIVYDGMCSAVSAMEYAQKSIQTVNDPGIDALNRFLVKANLTRQIIDNQSSNINDLTKAGIDPNGGKLATTSESLTFGSQLDSERESDPVHIQKLASSFKENVADNIVDKIASKVGKPLNKEQLKKWPPEINRAFEAGVRAHYSANMENCMAQRLELGVKLASADRALGVAKRGADRNAIALAERDVARVRTEIDKLSANVNFSDRHFRIMAEDFVDKAAKKILDSVPDASPDFSYPLNENDNTCGDFSAASAQPTPSGAPKKVNHQK